MTQLIARSAAFAPGRASAPAPAPAPGPASATADVLGGPWPASARPGPGADLLVGGVGLAEAAERFGTPLYVLDEGEVRSRARAYRQALPHAEVLYAAKAFLCSAMADWVAEEGLGLDVCSSGELWLAVSAGFPAQRILLHGNAKSPAELRLARRLRVGRIVIDGPAEIARLAALVAADTPQKVLVRVVPGIAAGHHAAVRTGVGGQKFGFPIEGGDAADAIARVLDQPGLELAGLHCHLGSQITEVEPYLRALDALVRLLAQVRERHGVELPELDLGGGHGIKYLPSDAEFDLAEFAVRLTDRLAVRCAEAGLEVPHLIVEPGRAIAGPAGVAVYRVLSVKHGADGHCFAAVDGGMGDNPRPALYGSQYSVRLVGRRSDADAMRADVVGRHCEAGDVLVRDAALPADLRPGDLLAVPAAGAYQLSMASGYNLVGRPAVAAVRDGRARLLIRRETVEDFRLREVGR
ncbi:diaminopimelate decarboxylase [Kitasatospora aureofaciens]|uniref:Diaminopimelate decarboxylase n=2 Tax=Kitasatospora aureofaciens TaxID=1894 RepID=A0A8H9HFJ9_KITAU|nr:diaminopimelate decarboxylase [Kitasatospora aureofaciens]ARF81368.1 diaminopimelate decarboxylase [Kitasatospora aureofaciens]QEV02589.1 diaminopimelate decarboxylase [Streptomyces viridifaciens]UKZ09159.1 diaminopimelate decarboxylase [Streptomyces viridifaciens]GGU54779.1 diaminopimelate decarboxylase [Kitasatospora aureofaciens]